MRWYWRCLAALLPLLWFVATVHAQCPTQANTTPNFNSGGSAFGRTAPQWNTYFNAKVDANGGVLCDPTIVGATNIITSLSVAPGLTGTLGTRNTSLQAIPNGGAIYPQIQTVVKTGNYTVNTDFGGNSDSGVVLVSESNSVTFTLPNPSLGTRGTAYRFSSDGTHSFALATVGGTADFYGCQPSATTLSGFAGEFIVVYDGGINYMCAIGSSAGLINLGPGLTATIGTFNSGGQQLGSGILSPQLYPRFKSTNYTLNSDNGGNSDSGALIEAIANGITFKLPNPSSGTAGTTYHLGTDGIHGFTATTVGGTAAIYSCPGAGSGVTSYTPGAGVPVTFIDDGTNYACYSSGIGQLTGDVTAGPGSGSQAATVTAINGTTLGSTTATAGHLLVGQGSSWLTKALSGDATLASSGAITVTDTNGVAFAPSATTDTTNASNISSGTLGLTEGGTGNSAASAQALAYALKLPYVLHQSGVEVTNTGIGTSEINLASLSFPALGANDALRITALWTTGGTATDTKNLIIRLSTTSCTSLAACSAGTSLINQTMNTASLVTSGSLTIVRNAGATNSQVLLPLALGLGTTGTALTTPAVQTNAGGFINIDCTTATSSADSCSVAGYTVELVPGN